ncbi:MAG TPA: TIGR01777 family oxidoreductase [Tepidisphaeraceae bacterium]|jgi:hypothetical protein|nr:TIGR01777 family oxidoreductase [Tepidisphaeraceae bacterium]
MASTFTKSGKVILAGGSGFLGQSLLPTLCQRFEQVVVLTRGPSKVDGQVRYVTWDGKTVGPWAAEIEGADAVVNYVGRTVDCRKTPANKRVILESRIDSVRALATALKQVGTTPRVWVQSATAHIYGDTGDEVLDESAPIGTGFAPEVGTAWEAALARAATELQGCRFVTLRISFVLGRNAGALKTLSRLARLFLGGTVGTGRQYISWIHVADLIAIVMRAIDEPAMHGMYVTTAPEPQPNREFMRSLRRAVGRPWSPPAPASMVRVGSWFMRTDPELALLGRRCVPARLMREGFVFAYPELDKALDDLLA